MTLKLVQARRHEPKEFIIARLFSVNQLYEAHIYEMFVLFVMIRLCCHPVATCTYCKCINAVINHSTSHTWLIFPKWPIGHGIQRLCMLFSVYMVKCRSETAISYDQ